MIDKIKTVGDMKKLLSNIDDDFSFDIRIMERVPDEELKTRLYPYPWDMIDGHMEFHDIGYSDKEVCIGVYKNSDTN